MSTVEEAHTVLPQERECPICREMMQLEPGTNDRRARRYTCRRCGYTMTPKPFVLMILVAIGVIIFVSVIAFFAGVIYTGRTISPATSTSGPSF